MRRLGRFSALLAGGLSVPALALAAVSTSPAMSDVLASSRPSDWRPLDPANTLYMELDSGRVIIDLAPAFAPQLVANVKALASSHFFDGLFIVRAQDNYVVQWGDAQAKRPLGNARAHIPAEFDRPAKDVAFTALPDSDAYAPQTGFVDGFPAARDEIAGRAWLTHCYAMVGAGRDNPPDSGNGTELYVVIGNSPRHLDRNVVLLGRVVQGMELLSIMPRGTGEMGFYQKPEERTAIRSIRLAADVPEAQRSHLEVLRTDTETFKSLVESRRNRPEEWFVHRAGHIEVCNVPLPVRHIATSQ